MFCFPVAAREFHVYAISDSVFNPPFINPPLYARNMTPEFENNHRTTLTNDVTFI